MLWIEAMETGISRVNLLWHATVTSQARRQNCPSEGDGRRFQNPVLGNVIPGYHHTEKENYQEDQSP
jgi:hypothetical protein